MNALTEKRNDYLTKMEQLMNTAEKEVRVLTDEETAAYEEYKANLNAIDAQIKRDKEFRAIALEGADTDDGGTEEKELRDFDTMLRTLAGGKAETRANITYGDNGAIIPTSIMPKIIDKVVNISPLFAAATHYSVKGDITIPYVDTSNGDITVAFAEEFSTLTPSKIKFSSITLKGYLAAALVLISKQMINNTNFNIVDYVISYIAKKIAIFTENYLINGNTAKNPKSGLKNSVTQMIGTSDTKLTGDILIDVQDTIPDAYQSGAFWLMNPKTRSAIRKIKDGQGNYLLVPDFSNANSSGWSLLGKPVYVTDNLPAFVNAKKGENFIYYGDFSGLAVKTGENAEIEVLNELYATQHAVGLNVWFEFDCTVEDAQKIAALAVAESG